MQQTTTVLSEFLAMANMSGLGLTLGFIGGFISLLIINGNKFTGRRLALAMFTASTLSAYLFQLVNHLLPVVPALPEVTTILLAIISPDFVTIVKGDAPTVSKRLLDFLLIKTGLKPKPKTD